MSTIEIKDKLIKQIQSTNDEQLLLEATRLMEIQLNENEKPFQLTIEMEEAIDEARNQIKNGKYLTHKKANKEIEEWLGE